MEPVQILQQVEQQIMVEVIKFAVKKQMFCKYSNEALDYKNCLYLEEYNMEGKLLKTAVISNMYRQRLGDLSKTFLKNNRFLKVYDVNGAIAIH